MAALGVGVLVRGHGWQRLLSAVPIGGAVAYHTLNNYAAQHNESTDALHWLETLDAKAWMMPLLCLAAAMLVDLRQLHRGKRLIPGVLLATEHRDGDSAAALVRYAAWRPPWTLLIALRFIRLRRALCYASAQPPPAKDPRPAPHQVPPAAPLGHPTAHPPSGATEDLGRLTARIAARIDASDHADAWKNLDIRGLLRQARTRAGRRRWLLLIPCLLALPSLVFLGIGSFHSQADLQHYISTGPRPRILLYCAMAALAWIAWQLAALLRTWRATAAQPIGEHLVLHRFRITTALGSATTGTYLLCRGFDNADPTGTPTPTAHLLEALDQAVFWIGLLLLLISLAALFPPGAGMAMAGGSAMAGITAEAAINAGLLGSAGIVLMAAGVRKVAGARPPHPDPAERVPDQLEEGGSGGRETISKALLRGKSYAFRILGIPSRVLAPAHPRPRTASSCAAMKGKSHRTSRGSLPGEPRGTRICRATR
ncbi:hypothetical protein ACGFR8_12060 [Streptomyces brevispora]|uniref:hypothetical protein n=2 Tax=Streptomyces brevispora TaxID=887462 RepID=UPI003710B8D1